MFKPYKGLAVIAIIGKGDNVTTEVWIRVSNTLKCELADIMDLVNE